LAHILQFDLFEFQHQKMKPQVQIKDNGNYKPGSQKFPHILVVDDEQLVCWSIESVLRKRGFKITTTNSGEEAIRLVLSNKFDVVITDLDMPLVNGFQVVKAVRQHLQGTPIIMISALGFPCGGNVSKDIRADYYIDKPFNIDEIADLVFKLVGDRYNTSL
jgi:two-component system response regulator AtoC